MARLLARRPLSHPAQDDDSQVLDARKPWPTPNASQWAEIETVACRVMVLLEWSFAELCDNKHSREEKQELIKLKQALLLLLHQLLLCHILDPNIDMQRLFRYDDSMVAIPDACPLLHQVSQSSSN